MKFAIVPILKNRQGDTSDKNNYRPIAIVTAISTRCTRGVRVVFSVTRIRSSNSARMNKFDFTTEKFGSVHMTVFEIVAHCNVDNGIQLLT